MNYEAQRKYLIDVIKRKPEFGRALARYRKVWTYTPLKHSWIVVGGQAISDHVILKLELKDSQ